VIADPRRRRTREAALATGLALAAVLVPLEGDAATRALGFANRPQPPTIAQGPTPAATPAPTSFGPRSDRQSTPAAPGADPTSAGELSVVPDPGSAGSGLRIDNGRTGVAPTMSIANGAPGSIAEMTLRITNTSDRPVALELAARPISESTGPLGGRLSRRLRFDVRRAADGGSLFAGTPAQFQVTELGTLAANASASWKLRLRFPDGGIPPSPRTGDNVFQASVLHARYVVRSA
jgi:hypothetical protein